MMKPMAMMARKMPHSITGFSRLVSVVGISRRFSI
jgi:hypothetical protein